ALNCAFYRAATDSHANAGSRKAAEAARDERQKSAERARLDLIADYPNPRDRPPLPPGPKDFDPDLAQTQLRQAMEEFGNDYRSEFRLHTSVTQLVLDTLPRHAIYLLNLEDEAQEFDDMKKAGDGLTARLFPPQGEASNAQTPVGLLRALFDDQVHDSRAWFMHSTFGSREPWGGYFRYRMIYFADDTNKSVSPLTVAGDVIGAATVVSGVVFTLRRKKLGDKLLGIAGTAGALKLEAIAGDILSGKALPMRPEADELRAFTREPGTVIRGQQKVAQEKRLAYAQERAAAVWAAHGIAPLVRNP
ncbi:DUF2235 domain-containing protein, partial [Brenneria sp. L4-2C]|nr:DUF2235 domain-containing protein [Brenneria sp. L3-3Z]MDX5698254.1 DUF2235 domain-containing protein [Brenneria sp. L4-2C]